jgi:predicted alpha/beta superfamily hydrolase
MLFLLLAYTACTQPTCFEPSIPALVYERTEVRTLHSEVIGQDYEFWISLPRSYAASENASYPVIYLMDPYRGFSVVKGLTDVLSGPLPIIQEVIVVGIGYGDKDPVAMMKWALGRTRDYTPVPSEVMEDLYKKRFADLGMPDAEVETGGAPPFLEFLRKEAVPFIESEYRVDSSARILSGYSLGGLFGLYVLFHVPDLFSAYFVGSPSIWYEDEITFQYENAYSDIHSDLDAKVFMSSGSLEEATSAYVTKMDELLTSRNYANLELHTVVFEGEGHASCYPAALSRALMTLLKAD